MSKKEILFDGTCNVCTAVACKLDSSNKGSMKVTNAAESELPEGVKRDQALKQLHVIEDGQVYKDIDAILIIVRDFRFGKIIYPIANFAPIKFALSNLYKFASKYRKAF